MESPAVAFSLAQALPFQVGRQGYYLGKSYNNPAKWLLEDSSRLPALQVLPQGLQRTLHNTPLELLFKDRVEVVPRAFLRPELADQVHALWAQQVYKETKEHW